MKNLRIVTIVLLLLISLNALAGGALLIRDPSGALLYLSTDQLDSAMFEDYLVPGIVLFFLSGLLGVLTTLFVVFRWKGYAELVILQGIILFAWMFVQLFAVEQTHYLQYVVLSMAVALFAFGIRFRQIQAKQY